MGHAAAQLRARAAAHRVRPRGDKDRTIETVHRLQAHLGCAGGWLHDHRLQVSVRCEGRCQQQVPDPPPAETCQSVPQASLTEGPGPRGTPGAAHHMLMCGSVEWVVRRMLRFGSP